MTTDQIIAEGRRYAREQQARIDAQRQFISDLENSGKDTGIVQMEKQNLAEMMKSLDLVLSRLRPVIERESR
jgi:hypothetical protein